MLHALNDRKALAFRVTLLCLLIIACANSTINKSWAQTALPKVIPPSPETAALFKHLDYPVDYSTGIPSISVPIYEVKSGSLSLPISLSYHAAGRKVSDQNGPVALGWSLNAGGMISRTVYGSPDFGSPSVGTYPFVNPLKIEDHLSATKTKTDFEYLVGIEHYPKAQNYGQGVNTWRDSEYDIFSYSLNGTSGKFIFKDSNGNKIPTFTPLKPFKLEWQGNHLDYISITDDKGILYQFASGEEYLHGGTQGVTSTWTLRNIISADKKDTISFTYTGFSRESYSVSQHFILQDKWNMSSGLPPYDGAQPPSPPNSDIIESPHMGNPYQMQRLTEIKFKNGKIKFNLHSSLPQGSSLATDMVKNIEIRDRTNTLLKTIDFKQSFLNGFTDAMVAPANKLDTIYFKDKNKKIYDKYAFEYYPVKYFSPTENLINLRYCDWWGYYNASGKLTMVPQATVNFVGYGNGSSLQTFGSPDYNREPDLEAAKSGIIKKVTYPTGGSTEFIFGLNKYKDELTNEVKNGSGLRIEQIKTSDGYGNTHYKSYSYGTNVSNGAGWGILKLPPRQEYRSEEKNFIYASAELNAVYAGIVTPSCDTTDATCIKNGNYRETTFYSGFLPALSYLAEKPILYSKVTEYQGTEMNNTGKTVYLFEESAYEAPSALYFNEGFSQNRYHVRRLKFWDENLLYQTQVYEKVAGAYRLRKQITNFYDNVQTELVKGFHVERTHIFPQDKYIEQPDRYIDLYFSVYSNYHTQVYAYGSYDIAIGAKNLASTSELDSTDTGQVFTKTTYYTYNPKQLISEVKTESSDNQVLLSVTKYPFDLPTEGPHLEMMNRNMLNYVVEQHEYKGAAPNAVPLKSVKTAYKCWGNYIIAPELVSTRQGTNAYAPRLRYQAYDGRGNVQQVAKEQDYPVSYLWGYNKSYPVAEVKNAQNNLIITTVPAISSTTIDYAFNEFQNKTKSFTTAAAGTIDITTYFAGSPGSSTAKVEMDYTLTGPVTSSGSLTLCASPPCMGYPSSVSLLNMPAGTYTLTIVMKSNTATQGYMHIGSSYPSTQLGTSGTSEFYYESFEEDENASTVRAHTGRRCNYNRSFVVTYTKPNNRNYIISWHQWDGIQWSYRQENYTGSKSFSATLYVDDIRVLPAEAQMTTYTYDPLVGMTSTTDANNFTTYYVYDDYGRLSLVKDDKGQILKKYEYKYANQ